MAATAFVLLGAVGCSWGGRFGGGVDESAASSSDEAPWRIMEELGGSGLRVPVSVGLFFCSLFVFVGAGDGVYGEGRWRYVYQLWETVLVFRSHLIWWFTSPSGCSLLRRGEVDVVGGVCPLLHRRGDGRWPSCLACAFIVYTVCWFSRYASLGAISKLCSFFVGRVVGSKASSPAAGDESNRVLLTRTCL